MLSDKELKEIIGKIMNEIEVGKNVAPIQGVKKDL